MKTTFYRPELDTLRFFAFFCVFMHHVIPNSPAYFTERGLGTFASSAIAGVAAAGAFGVDLFFLLSAFLITELLLRERENTGQLNVRAFYVRRILRIWPLYFLLILIATVVAAIDSSESFDWRYKLAFLFLSGNWMCGVFGYPHSIAAPLWSVSIEEQFYLLWPNAVRRARERTILAIAASLLGLAWTARIVVLTRSAAHPAVWCNTLCRLDPIAFGIVLAILARKHRFRIALPARVLLVATGAVGLSCAAIFGEIANPLLPVLPNALAYPVAAAACVAIFLGVYRNNEVAGRVVAHPVLTYLGKVSYGLYAFHVLCIWMATRWISGHSVATAICRAAVSLALTIVIAALSYHFFESPFLKLKARFAVVHSRAV